MIDESDLLRFIEGECSPEEASVIQAWIAADPRRGDLLDELRAVWSATGESSRHWDLPAARERLLDSRLRRASTSGVRVSSRPPASIPRWSGRLHAAHSPKQSWMAATLSARVAAVVAILIAGASFWYFRPGEPPAREYATTPGQRAILSLPDGSRVMLSVDTRLRVPGGFGERARAVELEGRAHFVVEHDPRRPFVVRTPHGIAEDLGTEFDVRAYPREQYLEVVVASGLVAVRAANSADSLTMTLRARERGVIDVQGRATRTSDIALDDHLAWTRGSLVFDDVPLGSVITELERWYDLEIVLGESALAVERITITITTESADEALSALSKVLDLRSTRAGRSFRLLPVPPRQKQGA